MSEPSYEEMVAEGRALAYELARDFTIHEFKRNPTSDEVEIEYQALCEKYGALNYEKFA